MSENEPNVGKRIPPVYEAAYVRMSWEISLTYRGGFVIAQREDGSMVKLRISPMLSDEGDAIIDLIELESEEDLEKVKAEFSNQPT